MPVPFVLFEYSRIARSEESSVIVGDQNWTVVFGSELLGDQDSTAVFESEMLRFWRLLTAKLCGGNALVLAAKVCDGGEVLRLLLGEWSIGD